GGRSIHSIHEQRRPAYQVDYDATLETGRARSSPGGCEVHIRRCRVQSREHIRTQSHERSRIPSGALQLGRSLCPRPRSTGSTAEILDLRGPVTVEERLRRCRAQPSLADMCAEQLRILGSVRILFGLLNLAAHPFQLTSVSCARTRTCYARISPPVQYDPLTSYEGMSFRILKRLRSFSRSWRLMANRGCFRFGRKRPSI